MTGGDQARPERARGGAENAEGMGEGAVFEGTVVRDPFAGSGFSEEVAKLIGAGAAPG
jgi:hypothetical protein